MGAITIKIPQDTNGTFEITDPDLAEKMLRNLKKSAIARKGSISKKQKNFSELSALLEKYRNDPDPDKLDAIKTAEEWRKRWDQ